MPGIRRSGDYGTFFDRLVRHEMKQKTKTIVAITLLLLAAAGLWVLAPLLGPSPVDRAWDALHRTTRGIVEYRQIHGTWPSSLAAVTNTVPAAYRGTTFEYDPVELTIGLPAEFEKNPLRLVSRGRLGGSETAGDFVVHIPVWAKMNGLDIVEQMNSGYLSLPRQNPDS